MKLVSFNGLQHADLSIVYPADRVADFGVFIPENEYRHWDSVFAKLTNDFCSFFQLPQHVEDLICHHMPVFQWVAKLTVSENGFLTPKAFKIGLLTEGSYRNFGYDTLAIHLLNSAHGFYPKFKFREWGYCLERFYNRGNYLGFLAWNAEEDSLNLGDRYLPMYLPNCARDPRSVKIVSSQTNRVAFVEYNGKYYDYLLPTFTYFGDEDYARLINEANKRRVLAVPLNFPPTKLENFYGFEADNWAQLFPYPGPKAIKKNAERTGEYLLIKKDDHMVFPWVSVKDNSLLRLSLDEESSWCWQETCASPFPDLNLYWSPVLKFPWIVDRKRDAWVPAFVVKDH